MPSAVGNQFKSFALKLQGTFFTVSISKETPWDGELAFKWENLNSVVPDDDDDDESPTHACHSV